MLRRGLEPAAAQPAPPELAHASPMTFLTARAHGDPPPDWARQRNHVTAPESPIEFETILTPPTFQVA